ncbi:sigma-70 family RNA polymerase sigma factor [Arthrobacter sp. Rue61a]|uniref:sigma-70 family RNA polymerase sigma factor n=1 Tax=Arthrobacter sp. Rue61a TaxID=1118963 RepID=UPI00027DF826|nr:sigma-70 family RNA polymerase sigma factor [Arthrobacter sp. Rue61a]AFR28949.1 putative RNA polymerase sigma factor domain protein [Arthrobacter sp. Rue61a]
MASVTEAASDAELILRVRSGDQDAFGTLFDRHWDMARYVAAGQANNPADIEDIASDAFASVHRALLRGMGPDSFFRAYLLTAVRRTAQAQNRSAARSLPGSDSLALDRTDEFNDPVLAEFESSTVATAFKSLPERWQEVLWYIDVEGMKPAAASKILGVTPNGVSSLAIRAREALRQAYLQHHIKASSGEECEGYSDKLGAYSRNGLSRRSQDKLRAHLGSCSKCTALLVDLNDVQSSMRVIIFPLITGMAFTAGVPGVAGTLIGAGAGAAPKSMSTMLKAGAVALTGAAVIVGATFGLAAARTDGAERAEAGYLPAAASANGSPVTKSPTMDNSRTPAAREQPTSVASAPPTKELLPNPQPFPAPNSARNSPAVFPVSASRPVPSPTPNATSQGSRPPSTPLPGTSRTPAPILTTTPGPAPTGPTTPSPTPSSSETTPQPITADFSSGPGTAAADVHITITFNLLGQKTPDTAEVDFSVSEGAHLIPGKLSHPDGWNCASPNTDTKRIQCTSTRVDPDNLQFTLGVSRKDSISQNTVDYGFTGTGLASLSFSNRF